MTAMTSVSDLIATYEGAREAGEGQTAAVYAYVIAQRLRETGDYLEARKYASECLTIAKTLPSDTLDDVTLNVSSIGGVPLPERFHDGVVRTRLEGLLDLD